jgi:hypothetical protein
MAWHMRSRRMPRGPSLLAGAAAALTIVLAVGSLVFAGAYLRDGAPIDAGAGQMLAELTLGASYAVVGWLIASRRSGNPLGWVYIGIGLSQVGEPFFGMGSFRGLVLSPGSIPAADVLAWLASFGWVPGYGLLFSFSLLLFPTGQLPSRRWQPVAWLAALALVLLGAPTAIAAWPLRGPGLVDGTTVPPDWAVTLQLIGLIGLLLVAAASVVSIIVRWRHSEGLERQQLKWFAGAVVPVIVVIGLSAFVTYPPAVWVLVAVFVTPVLPLSIGMAVLRYRLYEIDRIFSRTLGWAVVTGMLLALVAILVVGLQALLAGFTQGETLAVAASTLVAFALFAPLRRRVQRMVDRRFDRARYDGERTAAAFSDRLRGDLDLGTVSGDLATTAAIVLRPDSIAVWLRGTGR